MEEFDGDEKKLLSLISTVIKVAEKSNFISGLMENGELFAPLKLTAKEAYTFLKEIGLYEESGIMCRLPDWWGKSSNSIRLSIAVGEKEPSKLGVDAIMDFSPTLKIGDEPLTEKELRVFLEMAEGLVQYKGKWVEIDKSKLKAILQALDKVKNLSEDEVLSLRDALRLELNMDKILNIPTDEVDVSVSNGQWLKTLRESLTKPEAVQKADIVPSFNATLLLYQKNGFQWLYQMFKLSFGACLADDMGLGKTVQMIAFLEHSRVNRDGKVLLIIPASLIGNWQKEVERFALQMPYQILHKSDLRSTETIQIKENRFLYITTYGMAPRLEALKNLVWDYLILDEAQAIKNPGAKQTKAVKQIPSKMRIAMTGTPIENRLSDLWSLFDFLNQGLLGKLAGILRISMGR